MKIFNPEESKQIEAFVAWGSIAYLMGYLIVFIHTSSLGVPIVELANATYFIIGTPLAIVLYLTRYVYLRFRKRRKELDKSKNSLKYWFKKVVRLLTDFNHIEDIESQEKQKKKIRLYIYSMRTFDKLMLYYLPFGKIIWKLIMFNSLIRKSYRQFLRERVNNIPVSGSIKNVSLFLFFSSSLKYFKAFFDMLSAFLYLIGIPAYSFLLAIEIYPEIPINYAGGKSTDATLFVDKEKIPLQSQKTRHLFPSNLIYSQSSKTIETVELEVLYISQKKYIVRDLEGQVFSLDKKIVNAVTWSKN